MAIPSLRGVSDLLYGLRPQMIKWDSRFYSTLQLSNHFNFTSQKLTRITQHRDYLRLAMEKRFVPRGILKLSPITIGRNNRDLMREIRSMDYSSAIRFMHLYRNWYPGAIDYLRTRLFSIKKVLEHHLPDRVMKSMWSRIQKQHIEMTRVIKIRHGHKSSRDFVFNRHFRFTFGIPESVFDTLEEDGLTGKPWRFRSSSSSLCNSEVTGPGSTSVSTTYSSCVSELGADLQENVESSVDDSSSYHTCVSDLGNISDISNNSLVDILMDLNVDRRGFKPEKYLPVNLCDDEIDRNLRGVCALGRSFVPVTPSLNRTQMEEGFNRWALSLRRSAYLQNRISSKKDLSERDIILGQLERKLTRSDFRPPDTFQNPALEAYINKVRSDLFSPDNHRKTFYNLPREQREAIKAFRQDPDHIIRQQDKGGKFTYNTTTAYKGKIEETIANPEKFVALEKDPTEDYLGRVIRWADRYYSSGDLSQKLVDGLIPDKAAPGAIYGLDKTHKVPPTLRTITSGCGTATEKLSAFVAVNLQPLAESLPSVIRDTSQFLRVLEDVKRRGPLPNGCKLVTIDVVDMFASLDSDDGLRITESFLNKRQTQIPSTSCILDALRICLDSNCSQFGDIFVKQHKGAATGPKYVCDYADLAMSNYDNLIVNYSPFSLLSYSRYRDDCFLLWSDSEDSLVDFLAFLNSIKPSIQFTMKCSSSQIEYLDVLVYVKDGILNTTVYSKPTDDHVYLHPSSNHPRHQIRAIPRGQAIRLKRIISDEGELRKAFAEYTQHFLDRGYDEKLIKTSFNDVMGLDRLELLNNTTQSSTRTGRIYPLVIEHHPKLPSITNILRSNISILHSDSNLQALFPSESLFCAPKRGKNLKELLSPSRFRTNGTPTVKGCFANNCGKNCNLCTFMVTTNTIRSFATGEVFNIREFLHCDSKNVIYCINDLRCNLQNVGSTQDMKKRFRNYKAHIKSGKTSCNLYRHWNDDDVGHPSTHPVPNDQSAYDRLLRRELQVVILEEVESISANDSHGEILRKLETREGIWQVRLKTEVPHGLNVKGDFRFGM